MADETPTPQAAPESAASAAAPAPAGAPAPAAAPAAAEKQPSSGDRAVSQSVWLEIGGGDPADGQKIIKAKGSKNVHSGIVHVRSTFNNTMVSVTDKAGNLLGWSTSGTSQRRSG